MGGAAREAGASLWEGVAFGKVLRVEQRGEQVWLRCSPEDYEHTWRAYFDLGEDYAPKREALAAMNPALAEAVAFAPGHPHFASRALGGLVLLHHLPEQPHPPHQGGFERLCQRLGAEIPGTAWHAFPRRSAWPPAPWRIWRLCGRGSGPSTCWTPPGRWPPARWTLARVAAAPCGGGPPGAANHLRRGAQGGGVRACCTASTRPSASPWTCG